MLLAPDAKLRAVLDTNIYISAFHYPQGPSFRVWRAAVHGRYRLLISPAIVNELARVLRTDFHWQETRLQRRLRTVTKVAEIVIPQKELTVIASDPSDDRILECAAEGPADLIVSGDRHLRRLKAYQGMPIVTPIDFWRTLGIR